MSTVLVLILAVVLAAICQALVGKGTDQVRVAHERKTLDAVEDLQRRDPGLYEWAIVNDGPTLAVRAALASLLSRGAITRTLNGFQATGSESARAKPRIPLEGEIIDAAAKDPRVQILTFRVSRGRAIKRAVRDLTAAGFLLPRGRRRMVLGIRVAPVMLLVAGAIAVAADGAAGLGVALIVVAALDAAWLLGRPQTFAISTEAAALALAARRDRARPELEQTPFDPGIYVALYGTDQLWKLDPDLALQLGISGGAKFDRPDAPQFR